MTLALTILARLGLVLTILPPILFLFDAMSLDSAKWIMMLGTVLWLVVAPILQKQHEKAISGYSDDH